MVLGQSVDGDDVFAGDRQLRVPIVQKATSQDASIDLEVIATEISLDDNLPQAA